MYSQKHIWRQGESNGQKEKDIKCVKLNEKSVHRAFNEMSPYHTIPVKMSLSLPLPHETPTCTRHFVPQCVFPSLSLLSLSPSVSCPCVSLSLSACV